jgi:hypothetical protein
MLVFRSFVVGLLAACFALLVVRPSVDLRVHHDGAYEAPVWHEPGAYRLGPGAYAMAAPVAPAPLPPTIVDAAPGITPTQLALTIRLAPGEHITAIDDVAVNGELVAGMLLATRDLRSRQFIDVSVDGPAGERRVLVLLH